MREWTDDANDVTASEGTPAAELGEHGAHLAESLGSAKEIGERGEALAVALQHEARGHELLTQHTPGDKPQGIDIETIAPDGRGTITEVKATNSDVYRPPHTTENTNDHQMDRVWTARNTTEGGQIEVPGPDEVGDGHDQMARELVQIDFPSQTASVWRLRDDGRVSEREPSEIWNLTDLDDD